MYREGSDQYLYHLRTYGHPSRFGYKDVVALWKAEKFDPEELMDRYVAAGAKYFVAQAVHHDNFLNYDWPCTGGTQPRSAQGATSWQRGETPPSRVDCGSGAQRTPGGVVQLLRHEQGRGRERALQGCPVRRIDSSHEDLYLPNQEHHSEGLEPVQDPWYTPNTWWHHAGSTSSRR